MAKGGADRQRWQAFAVGLGSVALTVLDLTKINVTLPSISASLGASAQELQLLVGGYALAYGVCLVPAGRWGDARSRKAAFLAGLGAFVLASLVCANAPTSAVLVAGRLLQGCAAGMQMPQVIGLIQQLFTSRERGRAFGALGAMMSAGAALGPALAGAMLAIGDAEDGWRLVFWLNVPLGLAGLVLAWRLLPDNQPARRPVGMDIVGVLLLTLATVALMVPFLIGENGGRGAGRWLLLPVAALLGAGFIAWERRLSRCGRTPLVELSLFALPRFSRGTALVLVYYAGLPGIALVTTLYLHDRFEWTPLVIGLALLPHAVISSVAAVLGGRAVQRRGQAVVNLGLCVVIAGVAGAIVLQMVGLGERSPWITVISYAVVGAGAGAVLTINQALTVSEVAPALAGLGGSISQLSQRLGYAVGVTFISGIYYASLGAGGAATIDLAYRNGMLAALVLMVAALGVGLLPGPRGWPDPGSHTPPPLGV